MTTSKTMLPWNTRLGGKGEAFIKSRLLNFSNPTKYEMDIGLDFYCEFIENDSPLPQFNFFVQVKSKEIFDDIWERGIRKTTIRYWLDQQYPVFLIIYNDSNKRCYWLSIEDIRCYLNKKLLETSSDTIYIKVKVDESNILEDDKDKNQPFIDKIKESSFSNLLSRGLPQFIGNGYVKTIPSPPRSDIELWEVRDNVRASLYSLIQYYWTTDSSGFEKARVYCEFLTEFDKSHFNHFFWLGQIYRILGKPMKAKKNFREALKICQRDKNWPSEEMKTIIDILKNEIKHCKSKKKK